MRFRSRTTSRCRPLVSIEARAPFAHAGEMPLGRDALQLAELLLLRDEAARGVDVARHEDGDREPQMILQLRIHRVDLRQALRRQAELQPQALGGELGDVLVDDVADMLEVDGEGSAPRSAGARRHRSSSPRAIAAM